jgi:hypothetical protein
MSDTQGHHTGEADVPRGGCAPSRAAWQGTLLTTLTGIMFGVMLAFISIYLYYDYVSKNCAGFGAQGACESAAVADCVWTDYSSGAGAAPAPRCLFGDYQTVNCSAAATPDACGAESSKCAYNYESNVCYHSAGLPAVETGLFASAPVFGALIGPNVGGKLMEKLPFRTGCFILTGFMLLACVATTVARAVDSFALMVVFRVVMGIAMSAPRVSVPLYLFKTLAPFDAGRVSARLQPTTMVGFAIVYVYGFVVAPTPADLASGDVRMEERIHWLIALQWVASIAFGVVCVVVDEPPAADGAAADGAAEAVAADSGNVLAGEVSAAAGDADAVEMEGKADGDAVVVVVAPAEQPKEYAPLRKLGFLLVGFCIAFGFMGTGYSVLSVFVPLASEDLIGVPTLLAPLLFVGIALPSGVVGMATKGKYPARTAMLIGSTALCVCDVIVGVASLPGVVESTLARHVIVGVGLILFIMAIEMFAGSAFFELSLSCFPTSLAETGSGVVQGAVNGIGMLELLLFPIVLESVSGGPAGNKRYGFAVIVLFLAALGCLNVVALVLFMHPLDDIKAQFGGADADGAAVEAPAEAA